MGRSPCAVLCILLASVFLNTTSAGQGQNAPDPSEYVLRMTTLVDVDFDDGNKNVGSGFFYQELASADPQKTGPQWRAIKAVYLITNRHVVSPERFSHLRRLVFNLRRSGPNGVEWLPIELSRDELGKRLHLHPNPVVDVAAISVLDLIQQELKARMQGKPGGGTTDMMPWAAVDPENLPGTSPLSIETGDDLVVIGYPREFYDHFNKLPILKRANLITPWGSKYDNWDAFLIDAKLYEGSSGSIVITKPTDIAYRNGQMLHSDTKQFLFLGVFSGEPYQYLRELETVKGKKKLVERKVTADLGFVWYYYTVQQSIEAPAFASVGK